MATRILRNDGWQNLLTGMGTKRFDRTTHTRFSRAKFLSETQLANMYREDGLTKRLVNLPAGEMTRKWITIKGDEDGIISGRMEELKVRANVTKALKWARLFGGSVLLLGIDDGGDLEQPLNEERMIDFDFVRTYDRHCVTITGAAMYTDPASPKYGKTSIYEIHPPQGSPFPVHESRIIVFDGEDLPERDRNTNQGWGDSVVQSCYDKLRAVASVYSSIEHIIEDFISGTLTINNLQGLIATNQEALVKKRLDLIDQSRSVLNTTLLDEKEVYEKHSSTVTGLGEIVDKFFLALSAVSGIPVTLLMGQSPAGLNATGDSDIRDWYDSVACDQQEILAPPLERIVYLFFKCKKLYGGREPKNWSVEMNPLWELSDEEKAKARKTQAETDHIYITDSVLIPEEVAINRFGGEAYSYETTLQTDRTVPTEEEMREQEEEAKAAELALKEAELAVKSGNYVPPKKGAKKLPAKETK